MGQSGKSVVLVIHINRSMSCHPSINRFLNNLSRAQYEGVVKLLRTVSNNKVIVVTHGEASTNVNIMDLVFTSRAWTTLKKLKRMVNDESTI